MTESNVGTGAYGGRASDAATSGMANMKDQLRQTAEKAKSRLDNAREPVADKLQGAADTLREQASRLPGGETVAGAAQSAADKLESSATYLASHDTEAIMRDLMGVVKRHPTQSLLIAGVLGFMLARALRSD